MPDNPTVADAGTPRHPILVALVQELELERARLLDAADRVPAHARELRPAPDRWSAAEVLGHLAKVEASSGKLFSVHARSLRESGAPPESGNDARAIIDGFTRFPLHTRARRVEAPALVMPAEDITFDDALLALTASRARLLEAIAKADGLALGSVSAAHPRLGPLTMYEWLLMIARHEARHVEQLDEIASALS
jgi:hypothetical protein